MKTRFEELREQLLVHKQMLVEDDFGGLKETWKESGKIWAKVDFASASEIRKCSLAKILSGTSSGKRVVYKITTRSQNKLAHPLRFKRDEALLQSIGSAISETGSGFSTIFACEIDGENKQ